MAGSRPSAGSLSVTDLAATLTRLWANALGLTGDAYDGRNDG